MEIKIINKKESPLLSRTEYEMICTFEKASPKKDDIKNRVSEILQANKEFVVIRKIVNVFGARSAKITAYLYSDKGAFDSIEPKKKEKIKNTPP